MASKRNTGKNRSSRARTSIKKNDPDPSTPMARGGMRGERRFRGEVLVGAGFEGQRGLHLRWGVSP